MNQPSLPTQVQQSSATFLAPNRKLELRWGNGSIFEEPQARAALEELGGPEW